MRSLTQAQAIPEYKGAAERVMAGGPGLSKDALERASSRAGSYFDRAGGTMKDLVNAAKGLKDDSFNQGYLLSTGGKGGDGQGGANPNPNASNDVKANTQKETLAEMKAKLEMQKAVDLKWEKKKYEELGRKIMLEQIVAQTLAQTAQQASLKILDKVLDSIFGGGGQGKVAGGPVQ